MTVVGQEFDIIDTKLREELEERTLGLGAMPVIFPILASQQGNSSMAASFRASLQKKMWSFLIAETDAEDWLVRNNKEFSSDSTDSDAFNYFMNPYIQYSLFVNECINLDMSLVNGIIKLTEHAGAYKDRFSSMMYLNYIISDFDKGLLKENEQGDDYETLRKMIVIY